MPQECSLSHSDGKVVGLEAIYADWSYVQVSSTMCPLAEFQAKSFSCKHYGDMVSLRDDFL